jgi:WD40 repeat protein
MESDKSEGKFTVNRINEIYPANYIVLNYHMDSVNSIAFANNSKYYLVSGGADKTIIIWKIILSDTNFSSEKTRILKSLSDITEIAISNNDEYMFTACFDNHIYVYKTNFEQNQFTIFSNLNIHSNIITSICLEPLQDSNSQSIRFASYSDEGRLILAEVSFVGMKINVLKDYTEIINSKNKINSIQKKIGYIIVYLLIMNLAGLMMEIGLSV